jgi:exopolyphosphatase/guanosine-5'-triphosphate,3'-diphosphate pyrophosphatase
MTRLRVMVSERELTVELHEQPHPDGGGLSDTAATLTRVFPVGSDLLGGEHLHSDPPRPEELTNAIGAVVDHVDDLVLERPDAIGAEVEVFGRLAVAIAAVEHGGHPPLPFLLERAAAEDVFRTLATETARERRHNPGLADELVESVVAGCCIMVGLMRRLHLAQVAVAG